MVGGTAALDLVLVVVVYVALTQGPVTGMVTGSVAGVIQDSLSSGVVGIGGLAKSIVGFGAGVLGQNFIVTTALARLVMFMVATMVHAAVFMGLYVGLELRTFETPWTAVMSQALVNAVAGVIGFGIIESLPGIVERRRRSGRRRA